MKNDDDDSFFFCADVAFWQMSLFFPSLLQLILYYRCVFRPIGVHLGLREGQRRKANTNDILENTYAKSKIVDDPSRLQGLSDQLGMTTRQIERWFRVRRLQNKPTTLDKFAETG